MFLANLFRRKGRSILTLVGIAIGVAAMVALGALGAGLAAGYQAVASGSQADLVLSQPDIYDLTMSAVEQHIGDELRAMPEVRQVVGTLMGNVSAQGGANYFFVFGHDPQGFAIRHFRVVRGEGLTARGVRGRPLLLGKRAADALELDVGDAFRLTAGTFRVVGVYETGDAFEEGGAVISLADAQTLLQKHRLVSAYYIKLKDAALADRFRARVERRYPDLLLTTASEFGDKQQMVDIFKGMGWVVSTLAIVVGGVGMTNTVLMSVFERTREIGVLRAVGWRRGRVLRLILGESLVLALVGGALGAAFGVGIVLAVRNVPLYGILQGRFSADLFLQAFSTAAVLGLIGGLYPAWRASKLVPLEAMRQDGGGRVRRNTVLNVAVGGMTLKNLFRRKTRTVLTLVGIGIGVGAVVSMGGIFEGFTHEITGLATGSNAHLMAIEAGVSDTGYSAIDERIGAHIAAHPEVAHVSGIVFWALTNVEGMPMSIFILFGYHPQEMGIRHFKVMDGQPLTANRQVLLGRAAAEAMGKAVGDTVLLGNSAFRVVGIFESGTSWEEMGGVVTRRDAQVIAGKPRQVTMYAIALRDVDELDEVRAWLDETFPEIAVSLSSQFAENMPDMRTFRASVGGLAVLMALVGSVGMTNTILMSVLERTREIGVLRALGWSRRRILGMILKESLLLSGLSGLAGIGIGVGLTQVLAASSSVGGFVEAVFTPTLFAQAVAVSLALGALGGLYPAWRATRLQPVEALRYE
jgi:ABC-type antimicrobial peptide transport system permease subunit